MSDHLHWTIKIVLPLVLRVPYIPDEILLKVSMTKTTRRITDIGLAAIHIVIHLLTRGLTYLSSTEPEHEVGGCLELDKHSFSRSMRLTIDANQSHRAFSCAGYDKVFSKRAGIYILTRHIYHANQVTFPYNAC